MNLASTVSLQGQHAEAIQLARDALQELSDSGQADEHPDVLNARLKLANVLESARRDQEALQAYVAVTRPMETVFGPRHRTTLEAKSGLGVLLYRLGKYDLAELLQREVWEARLEQPGASHPFSVTSGLNLGQTLLQRYRYEELEPLMRRVREAAVQSPALGRAARLTLDVTELLIQSLILNARFAEAEALARDLLAQRAERPGPDTKPALEAAAYLSMTLLNTDKWAEAEGLDTETLTRREKVFGADSEPVALTLSRRGRARTELGRPREAEQDLRRSLEVLSRFPPQPVLHEVRTLLGAAVAAQGRLPRRSRCSSRGTPSSRTCP